MKETRKAKVENQQFTDDELYILSDGLLSLIRNCNNAAKLVNTNRTLDAIDEELRTYRKLNEKVCKMLK